MLQKLSSLCHVKREEPEQGLPTSEQPRPIGNMVGGQKVSKSSRIDDLKADAGLYFQEANNTLTWARKEQTIINKELQQLRKRKESGESIGESIDQLAERNKGCQEVCDFAHKLLQTAADKSSEAKKMELRQQFPFL
jgi:hypothetical protein